MNLETHFPIPHPQTAGRLIDGEAVLILSDASEINILNGVGSLIFSLCDGQHSIADIVSAVVHDYNVTEQTAVADTIAFLDELHKQNVVVLHQK